MLTFKTEKHPWRPVSASVKLVLWTSMYVSRRAQAYLYNSKDSNAWHRTSNQKDSVTSPLVSLVPWSVWATLINLWAFPQYLPCVDTTSRLELYNHVKWGIAGLSLDACPYSYKVLNSLMTSLLWIYPGYIMFVRRSFVITVANVKTVTSDPDCIKHGQPAIWLHGDSMHVSHDAQHNHMCCTARQYISHAYNVPFHSYCTSSIISCIPGHPLRGLKIIIAGSTCFLVAISTRPMCEFRLCAGCTWGSVFVQIYARAAGAQTSLRWQYGRLWHPWCGS